MRIDDECQPAAGDVVLTLVSVVGESVIAGRSRRRCRCTRRYCRHNGCDILSPTSADWPQSKTWSAG